MSRENLNGLMTMMYGVPPWRDEAPVWPVRGITSTEVLPPFSTEVLPPFWPSRQEFLEAIHSLRAAVNDVEFRLNNIEASLAALRKEIAAEVKADDHVNKLVLEKLDKLLTKHGVKRD